MLGRGGDETRKSVEIGDKRASDSVCVKERTCQRATKTSV